MNKFKLISGILITITTVAVIVVMWNMAALYRSIKERTLDTVRECAINSDLLEMISRMESSENASESFIRLNDFIELAQQQDGLIANADTLNISLQYLMRVGLEFAESHPKTDFNALDSIFTEELHRHGLYPAKALIRPYGSTPPADNDYWSTECGTVAGNPPIYMAYVSPLPGNVLSRMWGIIWPLVMVIITFTTLSAYLIRHVNRLRTIEQMKDDFTHNMTHELKTPVAVAYSAADSMLRYYDHSDEARNKQLIKIILQRLSYLAGMIENILSMSMERFKTLQLDMKTIQLKPLVKEVAGMIELKSNKPVTIDILIPDTLTVYADPAHLGNILSNLLDNAVKYSYESVHIIISADSRTISVTDNGIGIAKDHIPHIFEKFYRINSGDRYEVGGYGLGLYYVKQILDLFGWRAEVTGSPGHGTKFTILIS